MKTKLENKNGIEFYTDLLNDELLFIIKKDGKIFDIKSSKPDNRVAYYAQRNLYRFEVNNRKRLER